MGELPKKVLFDDEGESLLSENLWQLGWFATKTEVPVVVEDSNSSAVIFSGNSLDLTCTYGNYKLYPEVSKQQNHGNFELQHKSLVRLGVDVEETALFFFGAEDVLGEEHKAVIFNCDRKEPQFVDLGLIRCDPSAGSDSLAIDVEGCACAVKTFIRSITNSDNKEASRVAVDIERKEAAEGIETCSSDGQTREVQVDAKETPKVANNGRESSTSKRSRPKKLPFTPPPGPKSDFRNRRVRSDGYKPKNKRKILSERAENSNIDSKRRKCSKAAPSVPDTKPSSSELNELVGVVKSLANEVKELKQKQNEVQMPKLEKAPTPITVQPSLLPGFHMPNFFPPEQLTNSNSGSFDAVQVARLMLASQYLGMMPIFLNNSR